MKYRKKPVVVEAPERKSEADRLLDAAKLISGCCRDRTCCNPTDIDHMSGSDSECPFLIHGGAGDICALTGDNPEYWEM